MLNKLDNDTNHKITGKDYIAQISSNTNNEVFFPSTYTNFSECENILRDNYAILPTSKITFIQIQINNTVDDVLVNQIEYRAYDENKISLNLDLCNKNMTIYYSFKNDTKEKLDLINNFKKKGIDILNINDPFFNDLCSSYSESGKDLTLNNRIEEFYKNYTFCEKNCKLEEILYEDKMMVCNCTIKNNLDVKYFNFDLYNYKKTKDMNYKIVKCTEAFSSLKNNIGFWTFLLLMILNIILLILFCCLSIKEFKEHMKRELRKYGYVLQGEENHIFCHNYVKKLDKLMERLAQLKKNFINNKKSHPPPKHKSHFVNITNKSKSNHSILNDSSRNKSNKGKNLNEEINLLKKRMEKTKKSKFSKFSKGKDVNELRYSKENLIDLDNNKNRNKTENEENDKNKFEVNLMNINVKNLKKQVHIPNESKHILNIYEFEEALKYDKRSFCTIYYIFLISKQIIMHTFLYKSPIEPFPVRLSLLKFIFGCDLALNAFFYSDDKIAERYRSSKSTFAFALTNNFTVIILAILIGYIFLIFFANLNNSTNEIRKLFRTEENKIKKDNKYKVTIKRKKEIILEVKRIIKKFKIKITIFYIIEFLIMILFWYYVTVFCHVYKDTQISWLVNTFITIIVRILFDILINSLFALFYIISINSKSNCLYNSIVWLYCFS